MSEIAARAATPTPSGSPSRGPRLRRPTWEPLGAHRPRRAARPARAAAGRWGGAACFSKGLALLSRGRLSPPPVPGSWLQGRGLIWVPNPLKSLGRRRKALACSGRSGPAPAQHRSLQSPCWLDSAPAWLDVPGSPNRGCREEMVVDAFG